MMSQDDEPEKPSPFKASQVDGCITAQAPQGGWAPIPSTFERAQRFSLVFVLDAYNRRVRSADLSSRLCTLTSRGRSSWERRNEGMASGCMGFPAVPDLASHGQIFRYNGFGGKLEPHESMIQCAMRELEAGHLVKVAVSDR